MTSIDYKSINKDGSLSLKIQLRCFGFVYNFEDFLQLLNAQISHGCGLNCKELKFSNLIFFCDPKLHAQAVAMNN